MVEFVSGPMYAYDAHLLPIFRIILDLLRLNVAPTAIERMLKSMATQKRRQQPSATASGDDSSTSSRSFANRGPMSSSRNRPVPR